MQGCNPTTIVARLETAMDLLRKAKSQAASEWDDATHEAFEGRYFAPLEPEFRKAIEAIRHLSEVLAKAERDCT